MVKAINLGGQQFTAANGITYLADPGPTTGASQLLSTGADIVGTTDDPLYNTERFAPGGGISIPCIRSAPSDRRYYRGSKPKWYQHHD